LENVLPYLKENNINFFSCDLGPAAVRRQGYLPASPVLTRQELLDKIDSSLNLIRRSYAGKIGVENYNFFPTGLYENICQADFITKIAESYDLSLVLDLAHAAVTCHNLGLNFEEYLQSLPLDRVSEIHLSRPYLPKAKFTLSSALFNPAKGLYITEMDRFNLALDSHNLPGEETIDWLFKVIDKLPYNPVPTLVVVEYYKNYPVLLKFLKKLKRLSINSLLKV
jgi:uncharacterized protein (UPF0276 family)